MAISILTWCCVLVLGTDSVFLLSFGLDKLGFGLVILGAVRFGTLSFLLWWINEYSWLLGLLLGSGLNVWKDVFSDSLEILCLLFDFFSNFDEFRIWINDWAAEGLAIEI